VNDDVRPVVWNGTDNPIEARLLAELHAAGDDFTSGSALASQIGVSRTAVWKHVTRLRQLGYVIQTVPFRGYRLATVPDLMLASEIKRGMRCTRWAESIHSYLVVESTNDVALAFGRDGAAEGTVVVADRQTAGRGRVGRTWQSPAGVGIWFSVLLRPNLAPRYAAWLTLFAAVSVATLLRERTELEPRIKWPNDVLVDDKKVCGILTELVAEQDRIEYAVVGIGLNVNQTEDDFNPGLRETASSLRIAAGKRFSRTALLSRLLELLEHDYYIMLNQGFGFIRTLCIEWSGTVGCDVNCRWDGGAVSGRVVGLSDEGALLVRTSGSEIVPVVRGDVTLV